MNVFCIMKRPYNPYSFTYIRIFHLRILIRYGQDRGTNIIIIQAYNSNLNIFYIVNLKQYNLQLYGTVQRNVVQLVLM
jgi:hypothetical protein